MQEAADAERSDTREISDALLQLIATFDRVDGIPRKFGVDTPLGHLDIHLLQHIADHPQDNASAIARSFAMTRGAVSQHIAWLRSEGLLKFAEHPSRGYSQQLELTSRGCQAVELHEHLHERYALIAGDLLLATPESERMRLLAFLRGFDEGISHIGKDAEL